MIENKSIPHIRTIQIENYKSLASVSVDLEPFTVFVGPNGSGKSNFVDALGFVQECMIGPVEVALNKRGGIKEVIGRSERRPAIDLATPEVRFEESLQGAADPMDSFASLGVRLVLDLSENHRADYAFRICRVDKMGFLVGRERCVIELPSGDRHEYEIRAGDFVKEIPGIRPVISADRLSLLLVAGAQEFRPLWEFLFSMRFYTIEPASMRQWQEPDPGFYLNRDGSNAASVLREFQKLGGRNDTYDKFIRIMSVVSEGVEWVGSIAFGSKQMIAFRQNLGLEKPCRFDALNMSDGTLRALGVLLSVYQPSNAPVVGIEEPEATIHPAAAEVIMDALMDASHDRQILITTHSPDILDYKQLRDEQIRVVNWHNGSTIIAPVSAATRRAIRENLYTPGELLSVNELNLNLEEASRASEEVDLFGEPFACGGQK